MRVLVVGSGAREHALAWKIRQSPLVTDLLAAPGNPGIGQVARCVPVPTEDLEGQVRLAVDERMDLVVVGPEDPLAGGLVDRLQEKGIPAFGPTAAAAALEASKSFAKDLMSRYGIPTARYQVVTSLEEARLALDDWDPPVVVKADGLARGRGVTVARTREGAQEAVNRCLADRVYGDQGATVVLEECLEGEEVSLIGLSDGRKVIPLAPAEDHKPLLDGDRGPNTGGMGCFSPVPAFPPGAADAAHQAILQRTADAMRQEGREFRGALYAGLMLTCEGPKVLEFNARFGDPETEVLLPRLQSDLLPFLYASAKGDLGGLSPQWRSDSAVCVVLASSGYPGAFEKGKPIRGLESLAGEPDVQVFHAGAALQDGHLVTAGGRVLAVTALGPDLESARHRAYHACDQITFDGAYRRSDIGRRRGQGNGGTG